MVNKNTREIITKCLKDFFGEGNFDFPEQVTNEEWNQIRSEHIHSPEMMTPRMNMIPVTVRYDSIEVTNVHKQSHVIRDVYVRFFVRKDGLFVPHIRFYVARTKATYHEYTSGYLHSHPNGPKIIHKFNALCTGSGVINDVFDSCCVQQGRSITEPKFKAFLVALRAFLGWEEPGYNSIIRYSKVPATIAATKEQLAEILKELKNHEAWKYLNLVQEGDSMKVVASPSFELVLGNICAQKFLSLLALKDPYTKTYVQESKETDTPKEWEGHVFPDKYIVFKGQKVHLTITSDKAENLLRAGGYVVSPNVLKQVVGAIEDVVLSKNLNANGNIKSVSKKPVGQKGQESVGQD